MKTKSWNDPLYRTEGIDEDSSSRRWLYFCSNEECAEQYAKAKDNPQLKKYSPYTPLNLIDLGDSKTIEEVRKNFSQLQWGEFMNTKGLRISVSGFNDDQIAIKMYELYNKDYDGWYTPRNIGLMHEEVVVFDWVGRFNIDQLESKAEKAPPPQKKKDRGERQFGREDKDRPRKLMMFSLHQNMSV